MLAGNLVHKILQTDVERVETVGFPEKKFGIMLCLKFRIPHRRKIENPLGLVHHADVYAISDEPNFVGVCLYLDIKVILVDARQTFLNGGRRFGHDFDAAVSVCDP